MTIHLLRPSQLVRKCSGRVAASAQQLFTAARPNPLSGRLQQFTRGSSCEASRPPPGGRCNTLLWRYQNLLRRRPIQVQAVQAGVLMATGDFIAQAFLEQNATLDNVDYWRTFRFFALGLLFVGPSVRTFYGVIDARIRHVNPVVRTLQKVFVDQIVFAPIFLAALVSIIGLMQHGDVSKVEAKLRREYLDILVANYYVWPWVQLVNFRFVPLNYQVPLTQLVAVMWNIYISWKTNQKV